MIRQIKCANLQASVFASVWSAALNGHWITSEGLMGIERRLHGEAYLELLFREWTDFGAISNKSFPQKGNSRLFAEMTLSNVLQDVLGSLWILSLNTLTTTVTWLGSDAAGQGALEKVRYSMRCQTKRNLVDNNARLPIAGTRRSHKREKQKNQSKNVTTQRN
jgi:hypothetical protein